MNHLVPCPECSRHVRVSETECPFCALPLELAGSPEPQLPKTRLGRAATFAFSATLVSATALAACGTDNSDDSSAGGSAGATSSAGTGAGGTSAGAGGTSAGTGGAVAGSTGIAGTGSAMPVYGAPAAGGSFGTGNGGTGAGGGGQFPVYGAPP